MQKFLAKFCKFCDFCNFCESHYCDRFTGAGLKNGRSKGCLFRSLYCDRFSWLWLKSQSHVTIFWAKNSHMALGFLGQPKIPEWCRLFLSKKLCFSTENRQKSKIEIKPYFEKGPIEKAPYWKGPYWKSALLKDLSTGFLALLKGHRAYLDWGRTWVSFASRAKFAQPIIPSCFDAAAWLAFWRDQSLSSSHQRLGKIGSPIFLKKLSLGKTEFFPSEKFAWDHGRVNSIEWLSSPPTRASKSG